MTSTYLVVAVLMALGYGYFFYRRAQVKKLGGIDARPRFSETGKKGTKRTSQTRMGWDDGAIIRLEIPGHDPMEIDVVASAIPVLTGWSRGQDTSQLTGPYPMKGSV